MTESPESSAKIQLPNPHPFALNPLKIITTKSIINPTINEIILPHSVTTSKNLSLTS